MPELVEQTQVEERYGGNGRVGWCFTQLDDHFTRSLLSLPPLLIIYLFSASNDHQQIEEQRNDGDVIYDVKRISIILFPRARAPSNL